MLVENNDRRQPCNRRPSRAPTTDDGRARLHLPPSRPDARPPEPRPAAARRGGVGHGQARAKHQRRTQRRGSERYRQAISRRRQPQHRRSPTAQRLDCPPVRCAFQRQPRPEQPATPGQLLAEKLCAATSPCGPPTATQPSGAKSISSGGGPHPVTLAIGRRSTPSGATVSSSTTQPRTRRPCSGTRTIGPHADLIGKLIGDEVVEAPIDRRNIRQHPHRTVIPRGKSASCASRAAAGAVGSEGWAPRSNGVPSPPAPTVRCSARS